MNGEHNQPTAEEKSIEDSPEEAVIKELKSVKIEEKTEVAEAEIDNPDKEQHMLATFNDHQTVEIQQNQPVQERHTPVAEIQQNELVKEELHTPAVEVQENESTEKLPTSEAEIQKVEHDEKQQTWVILNGHHVGSSNNEHQNLLQNQNSINNKQQEVEQPVNQDENGEPDMDEERRRRNATYYGKRLSEVRNWLVDCLSEEYVPPAYELEEHCRSGILLARLANFFAPDLVSLEKIFDLDEHRFRTKGLEYKHTDNIVKWRQACESVKIKSIVLPETADIYGGRNIRTIFALVALAKRLFRLGIGPRYRDHEDYVLTDDDYRIIAERMEIAAAEENIDWDQIQQERHTIDSSDFGLENMSVTTGEIVEITDNTMHSLRFLCKTTSLSHSLYKADFALEDQKMCLNKLLESNDALKVDLGELEANIGLLVKNFRSIKENSEKKVELERKLEKTENMQASSMQNLSDESSVFNDGDHSLSNYDEEEPRSLARVSRQTVESRSHDEHIQPDYMLAAKAHVLTLLHAGVQGDTVRELTTSKHFVAVDDKMRARIEEAQKMLGFTLEKLIETHKITNDDTCNEVMVNIFYDVRNEAEREETLKEHKDYYDKLLEKASKNAQQMMAQIEAYRKYENACLKNMAGGINLAEELNKKVRKFLNRKQQAAKKIPVKLSAEKMIKKKLLFIDDTTISKKISKYSIIITPLDEPGHYRFESLLDGQIKHTQTIIFEELLRREALGQFRMAFDNPLAFDCLGLRRYLDRKYHSKSFA